MSGRRALLAAGVLAVAPGGCGAGLGANELRTRASAICAQTAAATDRIPVPSTLDQGARNAQDAVSMIQTGESALNTTHSMLQRMRQLAVQAANDTYTDTDRKNIQAEINQLISEIDRIAQQTPGAPNDDGADGKADCRIDPLPSGEHDEPAGNDDAERHAGIGDHMQEGAADIEIAVPSRHE